MEYVESQGRFSGLDRAKSWLLLLSVVVFAIVIPTMWKSLALQMSEGVAPDRLNTAIRALTMTVSFVATIPLILRLGAAYPISRRRFGRAIWVHLFGMVLFLPLLVCVDLLLRTLVGIFVAEHRLQIESIAHIFLNNISYFHALAPFVYCTTLGMANIEVYYRKYRQTRETSDDLEARLTQARLQLLKMQLHPHFLFNTLNAIVTLIHRDKVVARAMIQNLSELLTYSTQTRNTPMTTLGEELAFIRKYLDIEKVRFGENLDIVYEVDESLARFPVPSLLLQPIVENAVKHGTARKRGAGCIQINVKRRPNALCIQISDNGPGLGAVKAKPSGTGIGLRNTRERLEHQYGGRAHFSITNLPEAGVLVTILIPINPYDHDHQDPHR